MEILRAKYGCSQKKKEIEATIKSLEGSISLFTILGGKESKKKIDQLKSEIEELRIELYSVTTIIGYQDYWGKTK